MTSHEHAWAVDPGAVAHYVCSCGATGYRHWRTGEIRAHRHRQPSDRTPTARAESLTNQLGHGWVRPKPGAP